MVLPVSQILRVRPFHGDDRAGETGFLAMEGHHGGGPGGGKGKWDTLAFQQVQRLSSGRSHALIGIQSGAVQIQKNHFHRANDALGEPQEVFVHTRTLKRALRTAAGGPAVSAGACTSSGKRIR